MEEKVFNLLDNLNIKYDKTEHQPLYHVSESEKVEKGLDGIGCKTLFLKDKEDIFYLYVLIAQKINCTRLSFGKEEELYEKIGVRPGSVSPFGIVNNDGKVKVLIDNELLGNKIIVHPNVNTISLSLQYDDLIKVIESCNNKYYIV